MGLIKITSTNPKFSFLIGKNPASLMFLKKIRKGVAYGFFTHGSTQEYLVWFRDNNCATCETSYTSTEKVARKIKNKSGHATSSGGDYLNALQYTSPVLVLNLLSEYFRSLLSQQPQADDSSGTFEHCFVANRVKVDGRAKQVVPAFAKHLEGRLAVQVEPSTVPGFCRIQLSTRKENLQFLAQTCFAMFALIAACNGESLDSQSALANKVASSLRIMDAPYYLRYLVSSRLVNSRDALESVRWELETHATHKFKFQFGNTAVQRRDFVEGRLRCDRSLVDFGCGKGFYVNKLARRLQRRQPSGRYYAHDTDESEMASVARMVTRRGLSNVVYTTSRQQLFGWLDEAKEKQVDVIVSEVVEHMGMEESAHVLQDLFAHVDFRTMIVTTPNAEFNRFYACDGETATTFRHPDHKWEATRAEFREFVLRTVSTCTSWARSTPVDIEFVDIGDSVDGVHVTQGVVFSDAPARSLT